MRTRPAPYLQQNPADGRGEQTADERKAVIQQPRRAAVAFPVAAGNGVEKSADIAAFLHATGAQAAHQLFFCQRGARYIIQRLAAKE